ncbi:MAG: hypothetical protein VX619_09810 [bacterium]|nr:hypothetical protein [bacterium]
MKKRKVNRKGSLLVISIGLMMFVSFMTVSQLDTLKMYFGVKRMMDLQRISDVAARSGIDYGYAMIKNITESMSLNEFRFATHMHNGTGAGTGLGAGAVAEVPPSWQEIINHKYDRDAYNAYNTVNEGFWVGTDSHDLGNCVDGSECPDIKDPVDKCNASIGGTGDTLRSNLLDLGGSFKLTDPKAGHLAQGMGYQSDGCDIDTSSNETIRECAQEAIGTTTYTIFDKALGMSDLECTRQNSAHTGTWQNIQDATTVYEKRERDYVLDGHFGTKRWHYYDRWNFTESGVPGTENVVSDLDATTPRGTGGTIRKDPANLTAGASSFYTHRHILWERLFNYVRDPSKLRFPYEPIDVNETEPHLRDADKDAYHVELYTVLDLTDVTLDDSADEYDANLINPENYDVIKHKVFFKLWITRDEGRDDYESNSTAGTVVTTALTQNSGGTDVQWVDWEGEPLSNLTASGGPLDIDTSSQAVDLHPIWSMTRNSGTVPNSNGVNIADTSLFRPNYKIDFLDWDGNGATDNRLGAIGFPVPYLAVQRADYDIWNDTDRSTSVASEPPKEHDSYTRFTLWSLGTVREVDTEILQDTGMSRYEPYPTVPAAKQKISDFQIVSRSLYRMDFYMDVRAVDINDEEEYREDTDIDKVLSGGCDASNVNMNNEANYNAARIPACDLDSGQAIKTIFDPMGIYTESQQKWPYRDSKK